MKRKCHFLSSFSCLMVPTSLIEANSAFVRRQRDDCSGILCCACKPYSVSATAFVMTLTLASSSWSFNSSAGARWLIFYLSQSKDDSFFSSFSIPSSSFTAFNLLLISVCLANKTLLFVNNIIILLRVIASLVFLLLTITVT